LLTIAKKKKRNLVAVIIEYTQPTVAEFIALRLAVGWGETAPDLAAKALANSLFCVVLKERDQIIAMARVVGDGALFFYIQDVIVLPQFQGAGLGKLLMNEVEAFLALNATKGATVGLFSAAGKESFYQKYHYLERTGEPLGKGMCKFI
jgi:GNAT superfamily N-acetyltransferase